MAPSFAGVLPPKKGTKLNYPKITKITLSLGPSVFGEISSSVVCSKPRASSNGDYCTFALDRNLSSAWHLGPLGRENFRVETGCFGRFGFGFVGGFQNQGPGKVNEILVKGFFLRSGCGTNCTTFFLRGEIVIFDFFQLSIVGLRNKESFKYRRKWLITTACRKPQNKNMLDLRL